MATCTCIVGNDFVWSCKDNVPSALSYKSGLWASHGAYGKRQWRCDKPRYYKSAKYSWYAETKKVSCQVGMVFFHFFVIRRATGGKCLPKGFGERWT